MAEPVDLTNCDREPIHVPGAIQPHGCLIACDATAGQIGRVSANAAAMLGAAGPLVGQRLEDVIGNQAAHDIRNALTSVMEDGRAALVPGLATRGGSFDVAAHRLAGTSIIEFEPPGAHPHPLHRARELIGRVNGLGDVDLLISRGARLVHAVLGYDRVMIYRFEPDGSGKVVGETRRPGLESFLGQYFPASDIPHQARELYLRNTLRIVSDTENPRIAITPEFDAAGEPLDLSFAHLRSVSPIHCEYLRNMGVAASMSISIVVDGRLWGLIACHHGSSRVLPMAERVAAELFGQYFSLQLQTLIQKRSLDSATEARRTLDRFLGRASQQPDIDTLLRDNLGELRRLMPCDGVGLWMNGRWSGLGSTPPPEAIPALARHVEANADGRVWASHRLPHEHPAAGAYHAEASGVLAIPLSQVPRDYFFFFRKELVETLNWGGDPRKAPTPGPTGDRLTPRKSFMVWKETVDRQARPWTEADREIAEATRAAAVEIVLRHSEAMVEERGRSEFRQRMLNEELNHRVKNILAVIKSLVARPATAGRSVEDYVASLAGRIQALAHAHDQVARGDGGGTLSDLLTAELGPYRGQGAAVTLDGPPLWLETRAFSVMALMLHELATNAAKYGALSVPAGSVQIAWRVTDAGAAEFVWRERGGPEVIPPRRPGFGSALIQRSIPFDLGGESRVDYRAEGLEAHFLLPARHVSAATAPRHDWSPGATVPERAAQMPSGLDILLLEDQLLIAVDVEDMLAGLGARRVRTASTLDEARRSVAVSQPDVAVLDVNLGQGTSMPLARELIAAGIPFIFATGYGDEALIAAGFTAPVIRKPFDAAILARAIAAALGKP
ncbi:light-regulated signal transduction histidine kinase (bacteriophytochrome)/CheY-like chemotaxis protein [Amaricoccus macauensis]|uniref:histidine kinase n=1 Tax=Amaricoccus macauensis TaxID=57001 RepID=A0A840SQE3_9RHOB|nr:light-regulated signal transduction histidine kinase (bacteriophytochrome)/CheY-like chemotaxis protein [Amaricoccus macauensis]